MPRLSRVTYTILLLALLFSLAAGRPMNNAGRRGQSSGPRVPPTSRECKKHEDYSREKAEYYEQPVSYAGLTAEEAEQTRKQIEDNAKYHRQQQEAAQGRGYLARTSKDIQDKTEPFIYKHE